MNIIKHMEAAFVIAMSLAVTGSYLLDAIPQAQAREHGANAAMVASGDKVAVVTVSAKRPGAAEKLAAGVRG